MNAQAKMQYLLRSLAVILMFANTAQAETVLATRLNSDILTTEPGGRRDENTDSVLMHVVEGLVAARDDGSIAPMLASRWSVSADGRRYIFTLRDGITFHNGAPLTSAEVVWSLERYLRKGSLWRCRVELSDAGIGRVTAITALDAKTVALDMDRPAPMLLTTLARADCSGTGILHPDSVAPDGAWREPIGTGPFKMGTWERNQYVDLVRFTDYAALPGPVDGYAGGKAAGVDRVRLLVIPDGSSAAAALLRGTIQVLDNVSPTELGSVRGKAGITIEIAPTTEAYVLLLQTADPILADARIRQALALTIDNGGLTKAITWGVSVPNSSPIPASSTFYSATERVLRKPDIAAAKRLLAEAGYKGQPIKLIANRSRPQMFDAAILVQAMAREAGLNIEIETLDWATQFARYSGGTYQMMAFSFSARLDPSLNFAVFVGDKARDARKVWDTPRARTLLQRSMETDDAAARQSIFDQMHTAFLEEVPAVMLYNTSRIIALRDNVSGYQGWQGGLQRLWGVRLN